jgi:hypothetical protein
MPGLYNRDCLIDVREYLREYLRAYRVRGVPPPPPAADAAEEVMLFLTEHLADENVLSGAAIARLDATLWGDPANDNPPKE